MKNMPHCRYNIGNHRKRQNLPITHAYITRLGTGISIKSDGVNLVSWTQWLSNPPLV